MRIWQCRTNGLRKSVCVHSLNFTMNDVSKGDNAGGAGCDDPHVRICERPMQLRMGLLDFWRWGTIVRWLTMSLAVTRSSRVHTMGWRSAEPGHGLHRPGLYGRWEHAVKRSTGRRRSCTRPRPPYRRSTARRCQAQEEADGAADSSSSPCRAPVSGEESDA